MNQEEGWMFFDDDIEGYDPQIIPLKSPPMSKEQISQEDVSLIEQIAAKWLKKFWAGKIDDQVAMESAMEDYAKERLSNLAAEYLNDCRIENQELQSISREGQEGGEKPWPDEIELSDKFVGITMEESDLSEFGVVVKIAEWLKSYESPYQSPKPIKETEGEGISMNGVTSPSIDQLTKDFAATIKALDTALKQGQGKWSDEEVVKFAEWLKAEEFGSWKQKTEYLLDAYKTSLIDM